MVAFSYFIGKKLKYNKVKSLNDRIVEVSPIFKNICNKKQKKFIVLKNYIYTNFIIYNYPILSPFFNYYDSDSISKSSQILSLVSRKFIKNINYYDIKL
jgi:hypothetical protein